MIHDDGGVDGGCSRSWLAACRGDVGRACATVSLFRECDSTCDTRVYEYTRRENLGSPAEIDDGFFPALE